jgi:threonine-phosphate decarboxylase
MLQGHGNNRNAFPGKISCDFSSNVLPAALPGDLLEHLKGRLETLSDYPEVDAASAARCLQTQHAASGAGVLVTNGSTEAFYLLAHLFRGARSGIVLPSFAEYEDAARCYRHQISFLKAEAVNVKNCRQLDLLWLGQPNNPDGRCWSPHFLRELAQSLPQTTLLIDEAYQELCSDAEGLTTQVLPPNMVVVRSLTKIYGLAGLRAGYLLAQGKLLEKLQPLRMPWSVNSLALAAITWLHAHPTDHKPQIDKTLSEARKLQKALRQRPELEVTPSACNFFLTRTRVGTAADLQRYLVAEHGLLIRNADNFRGLGPGHFRVAAQTPAANLQLQKAIVEWLNQQQ